MGVDIGGTFTDVVLEHGSEWYSAKVLTTYAELEHAIIMGMHEVCDHARVKPEQIDQIIHGTTLATNALIERKGARTALVTTGGFRDVIEMRTESRYEQYDLNLVLPEPLLPRNRRYVVNERMDADGNVLVPLDSGEVVTLAEEIRHAGYESVAVGLIHSYANPAHEQVIGQILANRLPGVMVSLSSEVSPQMREYERFNTTIANAYIKPLMTSYLGRLRNRLAREGTRCPIFLMHSGGGIMSLESAVEFPVRLVESGPAGGAIFAADIARKHGIDKAVSFDMGGTTAKICLIRNQMPRTARVFEVARTMRFKKGSGMPISTPVIDMVEIGAGGGSLAHVDGMNQIRVGPESSGSEPGPACYGRGGTKPAVTDADLVLGRIDPAKFAGGKIKLHPGNSKSALEDTIGSRLDIEAIEAAWGISEVVDENMVNAARIHAVENGEDLAGYTMIAFGGAAPLHAGRLCEKLGIHRCIVPQGAGVGSAIGFLKAPFSFEASRSVFMRMSRFDPGVISSLFADMEDETASLVRSCDGRAKIHCNHRVYMRYAGQGWEIPIRLTPDHVTSPDVGAYLTLFERDYVNLFGRAIEGLEVVMTVWSVNSFTAGPDVVPMERVDAGHTVTPACERTLLDPASGDMLSAGVIDRNMLSPGDVVEGPAVITEDETTVVVPPSRTVLANPDGTLDMQEKIIATGSPAVTAGRR